MPLGLGRGSRCRTERFSLMLTLLHGASVFHKHILLWFWKSLLLCDSYVSSEYVGVGRGHIAWYTCIALSILHITESLFQSDRNIPLLEKRDNYFIWILYKSYRRGTITLHTVRLILTLTNLFSSILQIFYSIQYFLLCILFYLARWFPLLSYSVFYSVMYSSLFYLALYSILFCLVFYSVNSVLQNLQFCKYFLTPNC